MLTNLTPSPPEEEKIMQFIKEKPIFSKDEVCEAPLGTMSVSNLYGVPVNHAVCPFSQRIHSCHHVSIFEIWNKLYS